ncbi:phage head closure protein [Bacillus pseudomycoides]|uniref:phage head closure protein n=1 Tax=Bacillus pseudomycoides TaxID=64104 RepID=UPI002FFF87B7
MTMAKRNKRLTFLKKDENAKSPDGEPIEVYNDSFTVWGSLHFLKGREYFQAAATNSEIQGKSEIRYREDVTSDMKIKYKDIIYDIVSVIPTDKHNLLIMWKRGGLNG